MTTIAVDVAKKIIASESLVTGHVSFQTPKTTRLKDGRLLSTSGGLKACNKFEKWFISGANPKKEPLFDENEEFTGVTIDKDGVYYWDTSLIAVRITNQYWALGSGGSYAVAALHCGKSPAEAVALACQLDPYSGGEIHSMEFAPPPSVRRRTASK